MYKQNFCESCNQEHNCQEAYRQLGRAKGPSVVFKVLAAFLVPMVVFIASLAAFEQILAQALDAKELRTALSFLLALSITVVCIFVLKAINTQLGKDK